jgi:hypothetical protein
MATDAPSFIDVIVESHEELPDGCYQRWKALAPPRPVRRVRLEGAEWEVTAPGASTAHAAPVEDSSEGTAWLVYGGDRGLRLTRADVPAAPVAEPYLLVGEGALLG